MSSLRNLDRAQFLSFPWSCAASFKCFLHRIKACYNYTLANIEIMCTEDTVNWQGVAKFPCADN